MGYADRLTDGQLDCCRYELRRRAAVLMTREQVRNMLRGHAQRRFCRMLLGYTNAVPDAEHGLDTYEREYLLDIFAERICRVSHWPMNMDGPEHGQAFMEGIRRAFQAGFIDIEKEEEAA